MSAQTPTMHGLRCACKKQLSDRLKPLTFRPISFQLYQVVKPLPEQCDNSRSVSYLCFSVFDTIGQSCLEFKVVAPYVLCKYQE